MTEPPVAAGGVHRAVALIAPPATPAVAVPMTGAPGTVAGVTAIDRAEKALVPTAFTAATWKRYAVPLVRPVTTRLVAAAPAGRRAPTWVPAALTTRTENPVMGEPPLVPAVHRTVAEALPRVGVPIVGAAGAVAGVTEFDRAERALVPAAFTAATWKRYAVPLVRPVTTRLVAAAPAGRRAPTWVPAALTTRTENPVMGEPPLVPAVHRTVAEALPRVGVPIVGAAGAVAGVTAIDRAEKALVPTAFTAATWKRYAVPLVRPVTTRLVAAAPAGRRAPTWVPAALTTRTENPVMGEPPLVPAVHRTVAEALPRVAVPIVGAAGAVAGVTEFDRAERAPAPAAFTAATWKRYAVPLVSPVTTRLVAAAPAGRRAPTWVPAALTTRPENPVMGEPPLVPAVHRTVAEA